MNATAHQFLLIASLFLDFSGSLRAQGSFTLTSSSQTTTAVLPGQTNTFTVSLQNQGAARNVLVDVELSRDGQKVDQKFQDNVFIATGGSFTLSMTSAANLPGGTYNWSVGVFQPSWSGLLQWFNNVQTFTVTGGGTAPPSTGPITVSSAYVFPANRVPLGTDVQFEVQFTSVTIPSQGVLLDLELVDSSGKKVAQETLDNVVITANPYTVTLAVKSPLTTGTYSLNVGVFTPGFGSMLLWNADVKTLTIDTSLFPPSQVPPGIKIVVPGAPQLVSSVPGSSGVVPVRSGTLAFLGFTNFVPNENVRLTSSATGSLVLGNIAADYAGGTFGLPASGVFSYNIPFNIPSASTGTLVLTATGATSGRTASAKLDVSNSNNGVFTIQPKFGPIGTRVSVEGVRFAAGENVIVFYDNIPITTATASSAGGYFQTSFTVPSIVMPGWRYVKVSGSTSGASFWFEQFLQQ